MKILMWFFVILGAYWVFNDNFLPGVVILVAAYVIWKKCLVTHQKPKQQPKQKKKKR